MAKYIKADLMFDSIRGEFVRNPVITILDDQIVDVRLGDGDVPSDARVTDLAGCTLFPGFIDAHDHLSLSPQLENHPMLMNDPDPVQMLRGIVNMKNDLSRGITTSRCLGDKNFIDLYLKEAVEKEIVEGPRIVTCTRGIKTTHAHGSVGTIFNGVEAIRLAVRENIAHGADFVKLFITDTIRKSEYMPYFMSEEEIRVAVQEAHMAGKKVAAHSIGGDGLTHCLELGVDVIEHAYFANAAQIDSLLKYDRWVVLTPSIFFNDSRWKTVPASVAEGFRRNREEVFAVHQALLAAGIKYAIGTDATHGQLDEDVIFLVDSLGESMERALQGITINAARVCEREELIGSVEVGKKADLVAIKGDVRQDINAIRDVQWVMKDGKEKVREGRALF
jgi:imidazolonepropionase-like amidohydrolase